MINLITKFLMGVVIVIWFIILLILTTILVIVMKIYDFFESIVKEFKYWFKR